MKERIYIHTLKKREHVENRSEPICTTVAASFNKEDIVALYRRLDKYRLDFQNWKNRAWEEVENEFHFEKMKATNREIKAKFRAEYAHLPFTERPEIPDDAFPMSYEEIYEREIDEVNKWKELNPFSSNGAEKENIVFTIESVRVLKSNEICVHTLMEVDFSEEEDESIVTAIATSFNLETVQKLERELDRYRIEERDWQTKAYDAVEAKFHFEDMKAANDAIQDAVDIEFSGLPYSERKKIYKERFTISFDEIYKKKEKELKNWKKLNPFKTDAIDRGDTVWEISTSNLI